MTEFVLQHDRRGSIVVLAAILLVPLLCMVAFAIDIGYIVHVDTELQRTADACALAAVRAMPETSKATAVAQAVAVSNYGTAGPDLEVSDVTYGDWDRETGTFSTAQSGNANAVQVTVRRTAARGNPLSLFFAPILGVDQADVTATAIAMYDNDFCGPLVGIEWVSIPGTSTTDSYFSSSGSYGSQTPRDNGSVCSDGPITLDGSVVVNGDANAGKGHQTIYSGGAVATGNDSPRKRPLNMPGVDSSAVAANNDNDFLPTIRRGNNDVSPVDVNGNFVLDGGRNYTMPAGEYYFNDLTLTGQSILNFDGAVTIYVDGNLDTSGGELINFTQIPNNLHIFMTGGTARISGNSDFYGVVYAPNTDVTLAGNAGFFGATVGKTLTIEGTGDMHYDEDLDISSEIDLPPRVSMVQ
jgi:Flp pilus assembly protein TadG/formylmethanofuran dehydrogenase subunit C